ncbi:YSIRK-type signal peptide-containing protein, partial [Streptococcus sp. A23]|uniref:mucin-binding protein n=1 Tax=Streptococcus sp. A23 TaxID=3373127 RepID=UPI00374D52A6
MKKRKDMFQKKKRMFGEKQYRFSIRKFNVGVGSTVIAAFLLLAGSPLVSAQEITSTEGVTSSTEKISETIVPTTDSTQPESIKTDDETSSSSVTSAETGLDSSVSVNSGSLDSTTSQDVESESAIVNESSEALNESSELSSESASSEITDNSSQESSTVSAAELIAPVETTLTVEDGEEVAKQINQIATDEEAIGDVRTAGITYQVRYIDEETGQRVSRTAHTEAVETNRLNATTYVKVIADLPDGYELADGQSPVLVQQIFEKQTNILSFVVTKKKEDETLVSEPTTSGSSGFRTNPSATPEARDGYSVTELVPPVQDPNGYHVQAVAGEYTNNVLTSYLLYSTRMEDTATDAAGNDIPTKLYLTKVDANNTNSIQASIVVDLTQPAETTIAFDGGTISLDTPIRVRGSNLPTATYSLATGSNKRLDSIFLQGAVNTDNSLVNAFGVTVSPYTYQLTKYRDKTTGAELAPVYVQEGWRYDSYTTAPIDIPGYTLVGDSGNTDAYINHGRNYVAGDVLYQKSSFPINIYDSDNKDRKIIGTQETQFYRKLVFTETSTLYTEYYQVIGDAASTPSPEEFFAQLEAGTLNIITDKLFAATRADGVTLSGGHTLNSPVNATKKIGDYFTTDKTGVYPLRNPSSLLARYPDDVSSFTPAEVLALPTVSDSPVEVSASNPGSAILPATLSYVHLLENSAPTKTASVRMTAYFGLVYSSSTGSDVTYYYTANPQVAAVKFVDTTDSSVQYTENLNGKTAETFGWDPATKIAEFEAMGYTVVNRDGYDPTGTYDTIDGNVQEFTYELTPKTTQVTDNPLVFTRTTNYIKEEDSSQVAAPYTTTVTYERTGTRNEVTGSVTWNSWKAKDGDTILEGQALPTLAGYSVKSVTSNYGTVTPVSVVGDIDTADLISTGNYDLVETVVYAKAAQIGSVKFVDTSDKSVKFTETLNGQTGDEFGYDPAAKIKEFENLGY